MQQQSINAQYNQNVDASDVLMVFRCINSMNSTNNMDKVSKDVIDTENNCLINSYGNKILFSNRFIYNDLSQLLIKIGYITNDSNKVKKTYEILISVINILFCIEEMDIDDKVESFRLICLNYETLYNKIVNLNETGINYRDILKSIFDSLKKHEITNNYSKVKKYNYKSS